MKKVLAVLISLVLAVGVLTACGSSNKSSKSTSTTSSNSYTGMVSSVDGSTITFTEVQMEQPEDMTDENGETKDFSEMKNKEMPTDENGETKNFKEMKQGEAPTGENGSAQAGPGNGNSGGREMTTGAEHIITVTDDTKITISDDGTDKEGTISDVAKGTMITVTLDSNDNALIIKVQKGGRSEMNKPEESTSSAE